MNIIEGIKVFEEIEVLEGNFFATDKLTEAMRKNAKIFIVASNWNRIVVDRLILGAIESLKKFGLDKNNIKVIKASGAWELPLVIETILESDLVFGADARAQEAAEEENDFETEQEDNEIASEFVGIVALGAIIEGGTSHFELISNACNQGLAKLSLDFGVPIGNGVLACKNLDQALDRAGGKMGNKGEEAALAVIETLTLIGQIQFKDKNAN